MSLQHVQQQQPQPHRDSESFVVGSSLPTSAVLAELLPGHSRNSSGTSHSGSGSASGYGSLASQSQHSRQSSSGELGHFRLVLLPFFVNPFLVFFFWSTSAFSVHFVLLSWGIVFLIFVLFAGLFFFFFSLVHLSIVVGWATVDFRRGQSGLRASPSCVCLSAAALASSLCPLWHRPTGPLPTLLPHLPASAAAVELAILAVTGRKRGSSRSTLAIIRVHWCDRTLVGGPSVRWPLGGRSRSV